MENASEGERVGDPPQIGDRTARVLILAWGAVLAGWLGRVYFLHAPGRIHVNHESWAYVARLIEFRDLLAAGYLSPQWATHFRQGLGAPYFGYYQPGFFYAAAVVPWALAPVRAVGVAVVAMAWLGYAGMFGLVRRYFGTLSGGLAASLLLLAVYPATNVYVRGDLSELSAMMLLPIVLYALSGWFTDGRLRHAALLAASLGALIAMHPAIGLVGYGGLVTLVLALVAAPATRTRALGALAAFAAGIGLASFYWMPVFFEWDMVSPQAAFTNQYHYAQNFVEPRQLLAPYSRRGVVPSSLGPILPSLIVFNGALLMIGRRRATSGQRTCWLIGLAAMAGAIFLMSSASAFVWEHFTLLQRLQFPWRILAFVTIAGAALAGAVLPWRREWLRVLCVLAIVGAAAWLSRDYTAYRVWPKKRSPQIVEEIEAIYFRPDARDEWLPRGARIRAVDRLDRLPRAGRGAEVRAFERHQGLLRAEVRSTRRSSVVLPHYTFPVGWRATLDGEPLVLSADADGLMRVTLPAGSDGLLEVRFTRTPARARGLAVSGLTAIAGAVFLGVVHRRRSGLDARRPPIGGRGHSDRSPQGICHNTLTRTQKRKGP